MDSPKSASLMAPRRSASKMFSGLQSRHSRPYTSKGFPAILAIGRRVVCMYTHASACSPHACTCVGTARICMAAAGPQPTHGMRMS